MRNCGDGSGQSGISASAVAYLAPLVHAVLAVTVLAVTLLGGAVLAGADGQALADPILEVQAADGTLLRSFTRAELLAMPQATILTKNDFVDGKVAFSGPRAASVLAAAGMPLTGAVVMQAANDYKVEIAVAELIRYGAIMALSMNGKQLSLRDKGPIWLIYPMSEFPELQDPVYNDRLIWQLVRVRAK